MVVISRMDHFKLIKRYVQAVYTALLSHHFCIGNWQLHFCKKEYILLLPTHNPRNINVQTVPCLGQSFVSLALSYLHLPKQPCVQIGLLAAKKRRQEILPTLFLWVHIDRANGHKKNILVITNAFTACIRTVKSRGPILRVTSSEKSLRLC